LSVAGFAMLMALLAVDGCSPHRPSFVSRVHEDCALLVIAGRVICLTASGIRNPRSDHRMRVVIRNAVTVGKCEVDRAVPRPCSSNSSLNCMT